MEKVVHEDVRGDGADLGGVDRLEGGDKVVDRLDLALREQLLAVALAEGEGGLERKAEAADDVVLGAPQLVLGDGFVDEPLELVEADADGLGELLTADAGGDGEDASIGEVAVAGAHGVGQAAPLAYLVEEPRGHTRAEDVVEDADGEAAGVAATEEGQTEHDAALVDVARVDANAGAGRVWVVRGDVGEGAGGHLGEAGLGQFEHLLVGAVPGDGEDHVRAQVPVLHVTHEVGAVHLADKLDAAANIPAAGLLAVDGDAEEAARPGAGVVVVPLELLLDDGALAVDLLLGEGGMEEHVGGYVDCSFEAVERDDVPVAGVFLARVGIEGAARALDLLGDHVGAGAALGSLEDHVLKEVGDAVQALGLGAGASANEEVDGGGLGGGDGGGDDTEPVGERGCLPGNGHGCGSLSFWAGWAYSTIARGTLRDGAGIDRWANSH